MAAFTDEQIDWRRLDVMALLACHGLAAVTPEDREHCLQWLRTEGYRVETVDCSVGYRSLLEHLGTLFRWVDQFGHRLEEGNGNLNALRDGFGFGFHVPDVGGLVFELRHVNIIWREQPGWTLGLLSIAAEHSLHHLACGRRFFSLLTMPVDCSLAGGPFNEMCVPGPKSFHRWQKSEEAS